MLKYSSFRLLIKYMITSQIPKIVIKRFTFFSYSIRMSGKEVNFEYEKIKKSNFYKNRVIRIDNIDVDKILVSKEEPCGSKNSFKYFIGYNDKGVIRPLCIKLPQMIEYVKSFESNTTTSFKISDKQLLKKQNQIWKKVKNLLKIKFDSEPVYGDNDKYIKTKIKVYESNVNINFQDKGMSKEKASYKCLSIIMLDSVVKVKKKYCPQTLLEECKYEIKKTKIEDFIDDELEASSSDDETDVATDDDETECNDQKNSDEPDE